MNPRLVAIRTSQAEFEPFRSRQPDTFISYQGQRPSSGAVPAPDLRALRVGGKNDPKKPKAEDLLTALLVRHWKGGVDQGQAAKLIGIRKEEFAELAALRHCLLILENMGWRYYLARFNYAFPECDQHAVKRTPVNMASLIRRTYTDAELLAPPQREPEPLAHGGNRKASQPERASAAETLYAGVTKRELETGLTA